MKIRKRKDVIYEIIPEQGETVLEIPEGVTVVDSKIVDKAKCKNIEKIVFPQSLKEVKTGTFKGYKKIREVVFLGEDTVIGKEVFCECDRLCKVVLPARLEVLEDKTFYKCRCLDSIELPASLKKIWGHVFVSTGLTEVAFPDGLEQIYDYAFNYCRALKEVHLPESLIRLGCDVFDNTVQLEIITLPNSEGFYFGGHAFGDCNNLKCLNCSSAQLYSFFQSYKQTQRLALMYAYLSGQWECSSSANQNTVKMLKRAQKELFEIIIQKNDGDAMAKYFELTGAVPGDEIESLIKTCNLNHASSVTAVLLQLNNNKEAAKAGIKELSIDEQKPKTLAEWRKVFVVSIISDSEVALGKYKGFSQKVIIPETVGNRKVVKLKSGVFEGQENIESVIVPPTVTKIEFNAFENCPNLKELYIPASVQYLDIWDFFRSSDLTIYTPTGSYAEKEAQERGIPVVNIEE